MPRIIHKVGRRRRLPHKTVRRHVLPRTKDVKAVVMKAIGRHSIRAF